MTMLQLMVNFFFKHENIRKIATGQRNDYISGCLLDYSYFKDY